MCDRPADAPNQPPCARAEAARPARRLKLWELGEKYYCPVVGTCLSLAELEKLARKTGFSGRRFDAYTLHVEAVSLCSGRNSSSETMQKWLERKHALIISRFDKVKADAEVLALWKQHLEQGEVAGALWAALSHKAAGKETRHTVYADLHMLSHQVGGGQAADMRRLEWLERERGALTDEVARLKGQQALSALETQRLRQSLEDAHAQLQHLEPLLKRVRELESGQAFVALGRRLLMAESQASRSREQEVRIRALEERLGVLRGDAARLKREQAEVGAERDALERLWSAGVEGSDTACTGDCSGCANRLSGRCVLCVGGRTPLLPQYRLLAERLGIRLLHHDGGKEEHLSRLPDLLNASDAVICPTDCVGHLAYYQLKKHCKQANKPCVLAKSSGVASFAAALTRLAEGKAEISAEED